MKACQMFASRGKRNDMNNKKPFTIELEETTPMPHPAEVEQISDVVPPTTTTMASGRGLGLFG